MPKTFFMLAGETSGDLHGAKLIAELQAQEPGSRFIGMGGSQMEKAGLAVAKDLSGMRVMGFWEVAKQYGFFKKVFEQLLDRLKQESPSALICIDYPGFNLRFAREVRKLGIPIIYYILPQVWAWKEMRAKKMARLVDRAFCVFEFEPPFFEKFGLKTRFVGHPLLDQPPTIKIQPPPKTRTVSLLPGSRENEFNAHSLPLYRAFLEARERIQSLRAFLSVPEGLPADAKPLKKLLKQVLRDENDFGDELKFQIMGDSEQQRVLAILPTSNAGSPAFTLLRPENLPTPQGAHPQPPPNPAAAPAAPTPDAAALAALEEANAAGAPHAALLPAASDFSVVKSGTSTLEAGLAGQPFCVVYRSSPASYALARLMVNIPVFSLVNIVLGRYAVPELLQNDVTPRRIAREIEHGLNDFVYRRKQQAALAELPKKLGGPGASRRAAKGILDFLNGVE